MGKTSWAGDVMTKRLKTHGVQPALAFLSFSTEWRWLIPNMSKHVLVVNNLVASSLWHRLACADPPVLLLDQASYSCEFLLGQFALGATEHFIPA